MNSITLTKAWFDEFIQEALDIFKFSFPIMFCKVGFMSLGMVDAMMLGELGVNELAGSGIARAIFLPLSVFFMGILFSIDVFFSHALGANRKNDLEKIFFSGMQLALFLSLIFFVLTLIFAQAILFFDLKENVAIHAHIYLFHLSFGTPFLVLNLSLQRFLMNQRIIMPFVFVIIFSNILNYYLNKIFIFGEYGFTSYGVAGAALATNISRLFVFIICLAMIIHYFSVVKKDTIKIKNLFVIDKKTILQMFWFGIPAGGQRVLEVALFSSLTFFSATLTVAEAAAHHIAMLILNFCHNFPIAFSSAATSRIGIFLGKGEIEKAKFAGFNTIFWGTIFMIVISSVLLLLPDEIMHIFSRNPEVIISGAGIASMLGFCLILDGLQGCTMGVLRGAGDSKYSFYASMIGFYPVALFSGFIFCFWLNLGLLGLWLALFMGFAAVSLLVFSYWLTFKPQLILIPHKKESLSS